MFIWMALPALAAFGIAWIIDFVMWMDGVVSCCDSHKMKKVQLKDIRAGKQFKDIRGNRWIRGRKDGTVIHARDISGAETVFGESAEVYEL